jgi:hypothetical protein
MEKAKMVILSTIFAAILSLISLFIINNWILRHNDGKDQQKEITTKIEALQLEKANKDEIENKIKELDNKKQDKELSNQQYISIINLLTPMSLDLQELKKMHMNNKLISRKIFSKDTLKVLKSISCFNIKDSFTVCTENELFFVKKNL